MPSRAPEARGDTGADPSLEPSGGAPPCCRLDPRLPVSRTGRQYMPVVLSPLVCGTLLWQSQKTHTELHCFLSHLLYHLMQKYPYEVDALAFH